MGYQDVTILRDAEGNPIPQYYNPVTGQFEPLTGSNGAQDTRLSGSIVEDNIIRTKIFGSNVELANGNVVNETIAAGSMLKIFEGKVEATKINGSFRVGENGELAEIRYFPDNAENYIVGEPVEVSNGGERQKNFSFEVFTSHCRLYVRAVENDITLTNFNVIGVLGGKVL